MHLHTSATREGLPDQVLSKDSHKYYHKYSHKTEYTCTTCEGLTHIVHSSTETP